MAQISYIILYMLHQNTKPYSHIHVDNPIISLLFAPSLRHYLALIFFNVKRGMEAQMRRHADYAYFVPNSS